MGHRIQRCLLRVPGGLWRDQNPGLLLPLGIRGLLLQRSGRWVDGFMVIMALPAEQGSFDGC